ncbi:hypothetical protein AVEN_80033-1 [Araneus ventricosus]|uniref:Uncharacterized protein n=1 Tax=Araneus ventricosus TaxID=182803 RepID=A0A4Y2RRM0_ARAVE|nr:hypothetical protein AVEN_80033-1 [Araneus ventricosus]
MERFRKLFAEDETDEESEFGPEDILEENFSDHKRFREHKKSEEDGDSGNEEVNNSERFSSKHGVQWRKAKFRQNILTRCLNIMSRLPGTRGPVKDVTNPVRVGSYSSTIK